jgi:hypothetical protein
MHAGAYFAKKTEYAQRYHFDPIEGIDLKQRTAVEQILVGTVAFFIFLTQYLLCFLPKIIRLRVGEFTGCAVVIGFLFSLTWIPLFILHKISCAWIKISHAFDRHAHFCLADHERSHFITSKNFHDLYQTIYTITGKVRLEVLPAVEEEKSLPQEEDQAQALQRSTTTNLYFYFKESKIFFDTELNQTISAAMLFQELREVSPLPSVLIHLVYQYNGGMFAAFDASKLSGRKKTVECYDYLVEYAFLMTLSMNQKDSLDRFRAYRYFFKCIEQFDDIAVRNHCWARINELKQEKTIFNFSWHRPLFEDVISLKGHREKFFQMFPQRKEPLGGVQQNLIGEFKKANPHPMRGR